MPHKKKRSYTRQADAIAAALRASRRTGRSFRTYYCNECKAHHMTGMVKG